MKVDDQSTGVFSAAKYVDQRGLFSKPFQKSREGFACKESFYTKSDVGVCRGLHYQGGLKSADRVMHVVEGEVFDFVVEFDPVELKVLKISGERLGPGEANDSVVIPGDSRHCHGFITLKSAICVYFSSVEYDPVYDLGFDLFSIPWDFVPIIHELSGPVIRSERDLLLPGFN